MLVVPPRALLNPVQLTRGRRVSWTPLQVADSRRNATPLSTHQLLACVLAMWHAQRQHVSSISPMDAFFSSLPTQFDTTPLTWALDGKASLLDALPPSATHKHRMVQARYEADWARVRTLDKLTLASIWSSISFIPEPPTIDEHDFIWGWLCVNSRCVYMDLHYAKHEDNFTLAPLLDMANHTKHPKKECRVRFSLMDGLELYAPLESPLLEGEEVCITYGLHDNATLLTEYGFVLPYHVGEDDQQIQANQWLGNPHAGVWLDEAVEHMVQSQGEAGAWKRTLLQQAGYWGDYTMHPCPAPAHPSHRLHTALRLLCMDVDFHAQEHGGLHARLSTNPRTQSAYTPQDAERVWRLVMQGRREQVSASNEQSVRDMVISLCDDITSGHATRLDNLKGADNVSASMVRALLEEECHIASLVKASAERADPW